MPSYQVSTSSTSIPTPIGGTGAFTAGGAATAVADTASTSTIGGVVTTPDGTTPAPSSLFLLYKGLNWLGHSAQTPSAVTLKQESQHGRNPGSPSAFGVSGAGFFHILNVNALAPPLVD